MKRLAIDEGNWLEIKQVVIVRNEGKDKPTMHPYKGITECVLYDQYLEDVQQFLITHGPVTPIIVVQFAWVCTGEAGIETMVHVTRVLFNPIIPEVFDMRKWLVLNSVRLDAKLQYRLLETPNVILSDQFLIDNPRRNIVELYSERHVGGWIICCVRDHNLSRGRGRFVVYGIYRKQQNFWRFNIKARIFDGGEVTCLRLTNKDVETLLKVSCDQVLASIEAADYTDFPEILGCLIDQQLLFLVEDKKVAVPHVNQPYGTSTMRGRMGHDFANMTSNMGRPSFSKTESFGYVGMDWNGDFENDGPIDKHYVHWSGGET
ncbi:hypothetical protein SESBI_23826 [Sesbania bispinosa]|nr:hypothetical protein SESBI_23826 [Sesbania bispinosa]